MDLKSQTQDPYLKVPPEKIHRPQPDLNPRTLDLEASTLPRDHRGRPGEQSSMSPNVKSKMTVAVLQH